MTIGTVDRVKPTARVLAFGGVAGPATFVWSWARGGRATPGYSPFADHISELAAIDAPTRTAMTAGFVVYGIALTAFGYALRDALDGPARGASGLGPDIGLDRPHLGRGSGREHVRARARILATRRPDRRRCLDRRRRGESRRGREPRMTLRDRLALGLAGLLAFAGVAHFATPRSFDSIVPHVLPGSGRFWTYVSGAGELCLAVGVARPLDPANRRGPHRGVLRARVPGQHPDGRRLPGPRRTRLRVRTPTTAAADPLDLVGVARLQPRRGPHSHLISQSSLPE